MSQQVGPYVLIGELGRGGMGAVHRARQEPLGREVALKLLLSESITDPEQLGRFRREMTLAASVSHPNLVRVLDGGVADGVPYIAMELIDGASLLEILLRRGRLQWPLALAIVSRVADGLAHLHEHGILHRDVKPSNVMVGKDGQVKLADFGLARSTGGTVMTRTGCMVGTVQYLSPELMSGEDPSAASDLWATGVLLHQLVAGELPFAAGTIEGWIRAILQDPIPPLRKSAPDAPVALETLVRVTLDRDSGKRLCRPDVFVERCEALLAHELGSSAEALLGPDLFDQLTRPQSRPDLPAPGASVPSPATLPVSTPRPGRLHSGPRAGRPTSAPDSQATQVTPVPRATPIPTVPWRRVGSIGAVAAVVALFIAWSALRGPASVPGSTPSATSTVVSSSAVAVSPASPLLVATNPDSATRGWSHVVGLLDRLRGDRETARQAVAHLRRTAPADLGSSAESWILWVELGRWLDGDGSSRLPPVYQKAQKGLMEPLDEAYLRQNFSGSVMRFTPRLFAQSVRAIWTVPDDARPWFMLGWVYDLDGCVREARKLYAMGLKRLPALALEAETDVFWAGLVRAVILVPGYDPRKDFWRNVPDRPMAQVLGGLRMALQGRDLNLWEELLRQGTTRGASSEPAHAQLGHFLLTERFRPDKAELAWVEGLRQLPGASILSEILAQHYLARGRTDEARAVVPAMNKGGSRSRLEALIRVVEAGPDVDVWAPLKPWDVCEKDHHLLGMELERLLKQGKMADAESLLTHVRDQKFWERHDLALSAATLIGHGSQAGWVKALCLSGLRPQEWIGPTWRAVAAPLSLPPGRLFFQGALAAARSSRRIRDQDLVEAVWLSRQGRHEEALAKVEAHAAGAMPRESRPTDVLMEVACIPLFTGAAPAVKARARALLESCVTDRDPLVATWAAALRDGDPGRTFKAGRDLHERGPGYVWVLAGLLWVLPRLPPDREVALWSRRLEVTVNFFGMNSWAGSMLAVARTGR